MLPEGCGYSAASAGGSTETKVRPLSPVWKVTVPVDDREDRVVAAEADAGARPALGAALADQDVAGDHRLAAELLHAEPPALAVAAVAGRAACLLVCHRACSFRSPGPARPPPRPAPRRRPGLGLRLGGLGAAGEDVGDADPGQVLPVAALALRRMLAPPLLERDHLLARATARAPRPSPPRPRRRARRPSARRRRASGSRRTRRSRRPRPASFSTVEHVVGGDPVLLAAGLQHREHPRSSFFVTPRPAAPAMPAFRGALPRACGLRACQSVPRAAAGPAGAAYIAKRRPEVKAASRSFFARCSVTASGSGGAAGGRSRP